MLSATGDSAAAQHRTGLWVWSSQSSGVIRARVEKVRWEATALGARGPQLAGSAAAGRPRVGLGRRRKQVRRSRPDWAWLPPPGAGLAPGRLSPLLPGLCGALLPPCEVRP